MQHITDPLLETLNDLAVALEARELNRLRLREGLERGTYSRTPELEPLGEHLRERLKDRAEPEPGAEEETCPQGLSGPAEVLWRALHLKRLGCPRGDVEGLLALLCRTVGTDFSQLVSFVFGEEEVLRVRA